MNNSGEDTVTAGSPRKRQRKSCWPFDRDQAYPDAKELARLRALDQDSEEWLEERKKRLGASSSSAAVGLGDATPQDFWRLKTHRIEKEFWPETRHILERGHRLEPVAAQAYEAMVLPLYNKHKQQSLYQVGIVVHPELAWIHASPDRLIRGEPRGAVEIKCPMYAIPSRGVPDKYMCQVQHQMACLGPQVEWCDLFYYLHEEDPSDLPEPKGFHGVTGSPRQVKCWRIWRSPDYWNYMLGKMRIMADCLQEDRAPTKQEIPTHPRMPAVRTEVILEWEFSF